MLSLGDLVGEPGLEFPNNLLQRAAYNRSIEPKRMSALKRNSEANSIQILIDAEIGFITDILCVSRRNQLAIGERFLVGAKLTKNLPNLITDIIPAFVHESDLTAINSDCKTPVPRGVITDDVKAGTEI